MSTDRKLRFIDHPRAQYFDRASIRVVERYKTSAASGDEWRFSVVVELFRKGTLVAEKPVGGDMLAAAIEMARGLSMGPQQIEDDPHWITHVAGPHFVYDEHCCQWGCPDGGTDTYVLKKRWSERCKMSEPNTGRVHARKFCHTHRIRGDCGLDDADENYIRVDERPEWK